MHRQGTIEGILLIIKLKENQERKEKEYKQLKSELEKERAEIKSSDWREITAKYSSVCLVCNKSIKKGETTLWAKNVGIKHTDEYHDSKIIIWKKIVESEERDQAEWDIEMQALYDEGIDPDNYDEMHEGSHEEDFEYDMDNSDGPSLPDSDFKDESREHD